MEVWKQERPAWCPYQSCQYRASSQAAVCVGQLPKPEAHGDTTNTHRLCIRGAKDDGEWTFDLQINKGDGWAIYRLMRGLFGFGQGALATAIVPREPTDAMIEAGLRPYRNEHFSDGTCVKRVYAAMLAAGELRPSSGEGE